MTVMLKNLWLTILPKSEMHSRGAVGHPGAMALISLPEILAHNHMASLPTGRESSHARGSRLCGAAEWPLRTTREGAMWESGIAMSCLPDQAKFPQSQLLVLTHCWLLAPKVVEVWSAHTGPKRGCSSFQPLQEHNDRPYSHIGIAKPRRR